MNKIRKVFILLFGVMACLQVTAQDKIVNPDISYAGNPRNLVIGGINVSGVEGYEDYVLTGISGLSVGDRIDVPGDDVTNAVKRYWKHGLFSKVAIAADSIVGEKLYLHIYLAVRPRISNINYIGLKKSEREDMEQKLGMVKGTQVTPNMLDRAKILAKKYFDDKGFKNADIQINQRDDVANKGQVILDVIVDKRRKSRFIRLLSMAMRNFLTARLRVAYSPKAHSPRLMRQENLLLSSNLRSLHLNAGKRIRLS